jgi:hypothetical protein
VLAGFFGGGAGGHRAALGHGVHGVGGFLVTVVVNDRTIRRLSAADLMQMMFFSAFGAAFFALGSFLCHSPAFFEG